MGNEDMGQPPGPADPAVGRCGYMQPMWNSVVYGFSHEQRGSCPAKIVPSGCFLGGVGVMFIPERIQRGGGGEAIAKLLFSSNTKNLAGYSWMKRGFVCNFGWRPEHLPDPCLWEMRSGTAHQLWACSESSQHRIQ